MPRVAAEFQRLGIRHLRLSTQGSWLASMARGLDTHGTHRMTFLAPLLLLGLLLVPVLIGLYLWAQRRRSRYAVRFTNLDLLANIAPKRPSWRRHLPPVIYLAAVAFLVLGLARPSMVVAGPARGRHRHAGHRRVRLDEGDRCRPTRLDAAKAAARSFVAQLPEGIRVGVVAFASRPRDPRPADGPTART